MFRVSVSGTLCRPVARRVLERPLSRPGGRILLLLPRRLCYFRVWRVSEGLSATQSEALCLPGGNPSSYQSDRQEKFLDQWNSVQV